MLGNDHEIDISTDITRGYSKPLLSYIKSAFFHWDYILLVIQICNLKCWSSLLIRYVYLTGPQTVCYCDVTFRRFLLLPDWTKQYPFSSLFKTLPDSATFTSNLPFWHVIQIFFKCSFLFSNKQTKNTHLFKTMNCILVVNRSLPSFKWLA